MSSVFINYFFNLVAATAPAETMNNIRAKPTEFEPVLGLLAVLLLLDSLSEAGSLDGVSLLELTSLLELDGVLELT